MLQSFTSTDAILLQHSQTHQILHSWRTGRMAIGLLRPGQAPVDRQTPRRSRVAEGSEGRPARKGGGTARKDITRNAVALDRRRVLKGEKSDEGTTGSGRAVVPISKKPVQQACGSGSLDIRGVGIRVET